MGSEGRRHSLNEYDVRTMRALHCLSAFIDLINIYIYILYVRIHKYTLSHVYLLYTNNNNNNNTQFKRNDATQSTITIYLSIYLFVLFA